MRFLHRQVPLWIGADGPNADIVLTTRARLARNLSGYPFPRVADSEERAAVAREVRKASLRLAERFPGIRTLNLLRLSAEQKSFLLDSHLASVEQVRGGAGRVVITEPSGSLSIMVNEEDHIRIQSLASGLAAEQTWQLADWADDVLSESLNYAFSGKFGYLTADFSNVGTGLRVSALMHLAGLRLTQKVAPVLRAAWDLGVSVRGPFGESSEAVGDLYQVSNETTLGVGEEEIVQKVRSVAEYLLGAERSARKELAEAEPNRILDVARKSLAAAQGARSLGAADALWHLSALRLGAATGILDGFSLEQANQALVALQAGKGDGLDARLARASVVRSRLASAHIVMR